MRCLSFPFRLFHAHAFFSFFHHVCVCDCVGVSFSLAFFCCIFSVCLCVLMVWLLLCRSLLLCVVAAGIGFLGWRFPLDTSFSLSRYHRSTVCFHLLSHTTAANLFQFDSFLFSFCVNSSSTALTISFIRFVLIDFYGFCYLLLFASLCFFNVFLHNFYPTSSCFSVLLKTGFYPYKFYF